MPGSEKIKKSEFRKDLVSGDWIILAPSRAKRPHAFVAAVKRKKTSKNNCPFEDPQASGNADPLLIYGTKKKWRLQVIPNKYPSVIHQELCAPILKNGPYSVSDGQGHHEIIITRDHDKAFHQLNKKAAQEVFSAMLERYLILMGDPCLSYISFFHNWGPRGGASVYHPHYQMIAIPVVPPDVEHSLKGSWNYYKDHNQCVHSAILAHEIKEKKRIIFENEGAIAFCPFISRLPFEVRIFPKKHLPYFENTHDVERDYVVEALREALKKIYRHLKDPDLNFFIHTAPVRNKEKYSHYHWHIEILPRLSIAVQASFELGTGININIIDPNDAAKILSK